MPLKRCAPAASPLRGWHDGQPQFWAGVLEMVFGAVLRKELRSLVLAQRLLANPTRAPCTLARLRNARPHVIGAEDELHALKCEGRIKSNWASFGSYGVLRVAWPITGSK
jgi:hypothetical protein